MQRPKRVLPLYLDFETLIEQSSLQHCDTPRKLPCGPNSTAPAGVIDRSIDRSALDGNTSQSHGLVSAIVAHTRQFARIVFHDFFGDQVRNVGLSKFQSESRTRYDGNAITLLGACDCGGASRDITARYPATCASAATPELSNLSERSTQ